MRRLWLIFSQAVTVALAVVFVIATLKPEWLGLRGPGSGAVTPSDAVGRAWPMGPRASRTADRDGTRDEGASISSSAGATSFVTAARRASPSVVSVVALSTRRKKSSRDDAGMRHFFGDSSEDNASGMGSAVIVTKDGYLLTNLHVIDKADDIEVALADGRRLQAEVIGTDPESDLAVLKVEMANLPAIAFSQADRMQVGDPVLAIGNPFNVGQTATSGIISAVGRSGLGLNTFENFIQTDAAINPGNSGGALVDVQGHLLGINTAIYSRSGGSMGIGFAIPVSTARLVMDGLIRDGVVTRGWIGVQPTDVTPDTAQSLRLGVDHGVLISGVLQDGPARHAGVKPGDVVTRVGTAPVANTSQLLNAVAALKPDSQVEVVIFRGQQEVRLQVTVGQRPVQRTARNAPSKP